MPPLFLEPEDIGDELTQTQIGLLAKSFISLLNYVQEQHARCGIEKK